MEWNFGVKGERRKQLARAIGEILETPAVYRYAPTFAYTIGGYTVDRNGFLTGEECPELLASLAERGFEAEVTTPAEAPGKSASWESGADQGRIAIEMPLEGFDEDAMENMRKMLYAKGPLIKAALGIEELPVEQTEDALRFPWFPRCAGARLNAYVQFVTLMCTVAKSSMRLKGRRRDTLDNPRFSMRMWLVDMGMIGDEYKLARRLLVADLPGSCAWRHGLPGKEPAGHDS